jgi:hypothetical protein
MKGDVNGLPEVTEAMQGVRGLEAAGFREDGLGQFVAEGCRVTVYPSGGTYEIDIELPGGGMLGLDANSLTSKPPHPEQLP